VRALNAAALALLGRIQAGEQIPAVQLVEMQFAGGTERYCTAGCAVVWGGYTWLGLGLSVEAVADTVGDIPSLTLGLPAVSDSQIALALAQPIEGTVLHVYDALVDPATGAVADAVMAWSGTLNMPGIEDGPVASIQVMAEHRGVLALRAKPSRYTDDEQQRLHPGDTSLKFDPATDAAPLVWPAASYFRQ
jgi:hypothetical protein